MWKVIVVGDHYAVVDRDGAVLGVVVRSLHGSHQWSWMPLDRDPNDPPQHHMPVYDALKAALG